MTGPGCAIDTATLRCVLRGALALLLGALCASAATAAAPPSWPDTPAARLEALALIQTVNGEILASSSATLTLEQWCRDHAMAAKPQVIAHPITSAPGAPTAAQRRELQVNAQELVRYRRVELSCGGHILSIADNWYVPGRLTPQMNQLLDHTLTPFGKVVRALRPHRETIEVKMLWSPLPEGWEQGGPGTVADHALTQRLELPAALFEHRAILYTPEQRPIAEVDEVYQRDLLAFPEPHLLDSR